MEGDGAGEDPPIRGDRVTARGEGVKRRGAVVGLQVSFGGGVVDLFGTLTRTRCLTCELSEKPHWHAEPAKPSASNRAVRFIIGEAQAANPGRTVTIPLLKLVRAAGPLAAFLGENDPAADVRLGRAVRKGGGKGGRTSKDKRVRTADRVAEWREALSKRDGGRVGPVAEAKWVRRNCATAKKLKPETIRRYLQAKA